MTGYELTTEKIKIKYFLQTIINPFTLFVWKLSIDRYPTTRKFTTILQLLQFFHKPSPFTTQQFTQYQIYYVSGFYV